MKRVPLVSLLARGALAVSLSACAWLSGLTTYEQCPDECVPADSSIDGPGARADGSKDGGDDGSDGSFLCGVAPCTFAEACCAGGPADGGAIACSASRACPSPAIAIDCIDDRTCPSDRRCCARINVAEDRISVLGCFDACDVFLCEPNGTCADPTKSCQPLAPGAPSVCR